VFFFALIREFLSPLPSPSFSSSLLEEGMEGGSRQPRWKGSSALQVFNLNASHVGEEIFLPDFRSGDPPSIRTLTVGMHT